MLRFEYDKLQSFKSNHKLRPAQSDEDVSGIIVPEIHIKTFIFNCLKLFSRDKHGRGRQVSEKKSESWEY